MRNQRLHCRLWRGVEISGAALEAGSLTHLRSSGCADRIAASLSALPYTSSGYGSPGRWPHSLGTGRAGFRRSPNLNEYVLIVSDNGCGISGTPDGKGGLGKTIINGLIAQLQAQITCENGNGTTVTVKIPMRERAIAAASGK